MNNTDQDEDLKVNSTRKLGRYQDIDEEVGEYVEEIEEFVSRIEDSNERKKAGDWAEFLEKKNQYEKKLDKESDEYIGKKLNEIYEGETWESIEDLEKKLGHVPTEDELEEVESELNSLKEDLEEKKSQYSDEIENFEKIYNSRKEVLEYEKKLEEIVDDEEITEEDAKEIYEKKRKREEINEKINDKKKEFKEISNTDEEEYEETYGEDYLDALEEVAKERNELKNERKEVEEPTKKFPVDEDTADRIYEVIDNIRTKVEQAEGEVKGMGLGKDAENKLSELLDDYEDVLSKEEKLEKMRSPYIGAQKILNGIVRDEEGNIERDEDGNVKYKLEKELEEKVEELSEELDKKETRNDMVKAGMEAYEEDGELIEIIDDYEELSFGSVMAKMADLDLGLRDYDDFEEVWNEYQEKKEDMNLPDLTPALLAGRTDLETAKTFLLTHEGLGTKIKGPSDLKQYCEAIKAVEDDPEGAYWPDRADKAIAIGLTALVTGAGAAQALAEDTDIEMTERGPMLVDYTNETSEIMGNAQGEIQVNGTVETTMDTGINLGAENLSAGVEVPTRQGNITITEQDGHLELATGNATIKLNETDANITLDESTGELHFGGSLEGEVEQEAVNEFVGEREDIDLDIGAEMVRQERNERSLMPWVLAGAASSSLYLGLGSKFNKILGKSKSDINNKMELGRLISDKYNTAQKINEVSAEAYPEIGSVLQRSLEDIETESSEEGE